MLKIPFCNKNNATIITRIFGKAKDVLITIIRPDNASRPLTILPPIKNATPFNNKKNPKTCMNPGCINPNIPNTQKTNAIKISKSPNNFTASIIVVCN